MNYTQALRYIENVNTAFCKPGTERTSELCRRMGDPQKSLRVIHIAGTNGKGSTLAMLERILIEAGYKVGVFSSPAVRDFKEQIRINGAPITESALAALTAQAETHVAICADIPTSFELLTAPAFAHFKAEDCHIVILETGLGGKLDATNIIERPLLSIITGIALDHTVFLGDTVAAIAAEKAGIIKEGAPVLFGGADPEAGAVIEKTAKEKNAPFFSVPQEDIRHVRPSLDGTLFDFGARKDIRLSLLGLYQPKNAATVLSAVDILVKNGLAIPETAVRRGLADTVWHARFEILSKDPLVIYDGAHNPQGIAEAVRSIQAYFGTRKIALLTGVLRDKDYKEIAAMLGAVAAHAFTVTPPSPRALDAAEYADVLRAAGIPTDAHTDIKEAAHAALAYAKKTSLPLICLGSLYLYQSIYPLF